MHGKRRELGLGGYPLVTLAMAREAALANRRKVHAGGDPLAEKRRARGVPTFAEAARKVFEFRRGGWRNAKHAGQWITTLEQFVFPRIGACGVDEISTEDVIAVNAHRALPYSEVAGAIAAVRASGATPVLKLAFECLVLTAARSGWRRGRRSTWTRQRGPCRLRG